MQPSYLSNEELERYWFQYKTEAEIHGTPLEKFCRDNRISYKALDNWRRQTKNRIYPVQIVDPESKDSSTCEPADNPAKGESKFDRYTSCRHRTKETDFQNGECPASSPESGKDSNVRIMVTVKATNGLFVTQRNLDYAGLLNLVEKLEGLC